jgi:hypothetical protein
MAVINVEADGLQQKRRLRTGIRVSGEIMLCKAMSPHLGQFLPLKKEI